MHPHSPTPVPVLTVSGAAGAKANSLQSTLFRHLAPPPRPPRLSVKKVNGHRPAARTPISFENPKAPLHTVERLIVSRIYVT